MQTVHFTRRAASLALGLVLFFPAARLPADHGPGTSGGGSATQSGETLKPGAVSLGFHWTFTSFEELTKAQIEEKALRVEGEHHHFDAIRTANIWSLDLAYGVMEDLQIGLSTGWYRGENLREAEVESGSLTFHDLGDVTGPTDLWTNAKYRFLRGPYGSWAAFGGIKFPTGRDDVRGDDTLERLDPSLQPGSGAFDFLAGTAYSVFLTSRFTLDASLQYIRRTANNAFKIGDRIDGGVAVAFRVMEDIKTYPQVSVFAEANVRQLFRNVEDGQREDNSGGTVLFLAPGVRARLNEHFSIGVSPRFPVLQALNSEQEETRFQVVADVVFSF
jgi:hypothetical protein